MVSKKQGGENKKACSFAAHDGTTITIRNCSAKENRDGDPTKGTMKETGKGTGRDQFLSHAAANGGKKVVQIHTFLKP
jgi:hypothetical protein